MNFFRIIQYPQPIVHYCRKCTAILGCVTKVFHKASQKHVL